MEEGEENFWKNLFKKRKLREKESKTIVLSGVEFEINLFQRKANARRSVTAICLSCLLLNMIKDYSRISREEKLLI